MTKMTKKEMFALVISALETCDIENKEVLIDGIQHEIDLLNAKKPSTSKTKNQKENEKLMDEILNSLTSLNESVTITELQKRCPNLADYSNQKLSSMLRKLIEVNKVVKFTMNRKTYFSIYVE